MKQKTIRILLVEDDLADAALTQYALGESRHNSFEIRHADQLARAIQCLVDSEYDVVLLDLSLPDSQGFDALRHIRAAAPDTPVLVVTGRDDEAAALAAIEHGAHDYLVKDEVTRNTLSRAIRYTMQRQQILRERETALRQLATAKDDLELKNRHLAERYNTAHRFVDNLSHEFRTPLTVIREYCSIISEGLVGEINGEQKHYLDIAVDRVQDLNIMVNDMLDVSKMEANILGVRRRECHVEDIFKQVLPTLERKAAIKGLKLTVDSPRDLPAVYCDAEKIGRVVVNLAVNAIKFTSDQGEISLWARCGQNPSEEVVLGVTDNGPGISPADLGVIFERFKQLNTATESSTQGFGLGLSIARELVHLNLGEISVSSEPGQGSTFSFTVPVANWNGIAVRYIARLRRTLEQPLFVSLLTATLGEEVPDAITEDVDEYLHQLLRRNDLILRADPRQWLLLVATEHNAVDRVIERIREAFDSANRNRPKEIALPSVSILVKAAYRLDLSDGDAACTPSPIDIDRSNNMCDKKTVLIVDDDREIVEGLRVRLGTLGYSVLTAYNGELGVAAAIKHRPDAITLDIRMPVMDGLTVLKKLQECPETAAIPVIMVTASLVDQRQALDLGARYFLEKPYDAKVLSVLLASALNRQERSGLEEPAAPALALET